MQTTGTQRPRYVTILLVNELAITILYQEPIKGLILHTVPQRPPTHTSTRPSLVVDPPTSLVVPLVQSCQCMNELHTSSLVINSPLIQVTAPYVLSSPVQDNLGQESRLVLLHSNRLLSTPLHTG